MSQPAKVPDKVPEPSIDEILDFIRRSIVPEGDADKSAARKPASRKQAAASTSKGRRTDSDTMRVCSAGEHFPDGSHDGPPSQKCETPLPEGDPAWGGAGNDTGDPEEAAAAAPVIPLAEARGAGVHDEPKPDALLSPRTTAAVDTAFNSLTHTVLSQNPRTVEDLVREMLKPMLKAWLDANLPNMVERLVRMEIERLSRRG